MANLDFKQVSHITAEILLIGGISYYLNSRCSVLQARINEDRERIIAQEKRIEELESQVSQLLSMKSSVARQAAPKPRVVFASKPAPAKPEAEKSIEKLFFRDPSPVEQPDRQPARSNDEEHVSGVFPNDDMDSIDAEIRDELAELEEEDDA
jgi:hypothetical protein